MRCLVTLIISTLIALCLSYGAIPPPQQVQITFNPQTMNYAIGHVQLQIPAGAFAGNVATDTFLLTALPARIAWGDTPYGSSGSSYNWHSSKRQGGTGCPDPYFNNTYCCFCCPTCENCIPAGANPQCGRIGPGFGMFRTNGDQTGKFLKNITVLYKPLAQFVNGDIFVAYQLSDDLSHTIRSIAACTDTTGFVEFNVDHPGYFTVEKIQYIPTPDLLCEDCISDLSQCLGVFAASLGLSHVCQLTHEQYNSRCALLTTAEAHNRDSRSSNPFRNLPSSCANLCVQGLAEQMGFNSVLDVTCLSANNNYTHISDHVCHYTKACFDP